MYMYMYMQSDIIFVERCECECKKIGKVGGEIFPKHYTYPPQIFHISYLFLLPQKSSPRLIFLAASDQKSSPLSLLFSLFFVSFFSLCCYTAASLYHQNKISLSKEEIKGLILKFQLQIVGGK